FFQAEDGIRDFHVTGVQTCALPISPAPVRSSGAHVMNLFRHFGDEVQRSLERLAAAGRLPSGMNAGRVAVDPPRETGHGDVTTKIGRASCRERVWRWGGAGPR